MSVTPKHTPAAELRARIGQEFDGELHLTEAEAVALLDAFEECVKALKDADDFISSAFENLTSGDVEEEAAPTLASIRAALSRLCHERRPRRTHWSEVMNRQIPEWVREGQEVVLRNSGSFNTSYGRTSKISKVYKNGNFIVEGETGQWRPYSTHASLTGEGGRWNRESIVPLTDETRADIIAGQKYAAAKRIVFAEAARLEKIARSNDRDATIAAAEALGRAAS